MEIYLDNGATTRVCPEAAEAALKVMLEDYGNPSSTHRKGREAKAVLERARAQIMAALGARDGELAFTSGGSESDNWAILEGAEARRRVGRHILSSDAEHDAVKKTLEAARQRGWEVTLLPPGADGAVSPEAVREALRPDTALVSLMLVNNETGAITDIPGVRRVMKEAGSRALLHTDAVQGFLKVPCDPVSWGVDLMSLSGHKLGGPKGIGALYISPRLRNFRPLLPGGGQEQGLRSGTEATAQIAGFAKAVELRLDNYESKIRHMSDLKALCLEKLLTIPGVVAVGGGTAPHILSVSLPGYPSGNIVSDLGSQGICISAGSACHKGKSSHVVSALGLPKRTAAGVIRISFSPDTTAEDIEAVYQALKNHQAQRCAML